MKLAQQNMGESPWLVRIRTFTVATIWRMMLFMRSKSSIRDKAARKASLLAAALLTGAMPVAVNACTYYAGEEIFFENGDPFENDLDEVERSRRMAHYEEWLARIPDRQREFWADNAAEWRELELFRQTQLLVDALMPAIVRVWRGGPCHIGGPSPVRDDQLYSQLAEQIANAPHIARPPLPEPISGEGQLRIIVIGQRAQRPNRFPSQYATIAPRCNAEVRDFVAAYLHEHLDEELIGDALSTVTRHGYGQDIAFRYRSLPLLRFEREGSHRLALSHYNSPQISITSSHYRGLSEVNDQIEEEEWAAISAYLTRDDGATSVIAGMENALQERHDPDAPYRGYCPNTVGEMRALVERTLEERRKQSGPWLDELLGS